MAGKSHDKPVEEDNEVVETATAETTPEQTQQKETSSEDYAELNNRYLRLAADFDNFRKRQAQEREFLFKYGAQNTLEALLGVLDNLERAQKSLTKDSDPEMLYKSFEMLSQQLLGTLKDVGLNKMNPVGEIFDPERHEAVSQQEDAEKPDHTVLQVYQDGYMLHDRVIRPAQVVVAVNPTQDSSQPAFQGVASEKNPFQQSSSEE